MEISFLGTAGLVPGMGLKITGKRGQLSMLIDQDYLMEVGEGALRNLNANRTDLNAIKRILISHVHSDHFIGIVNVLFAMMKVMNRKDSLEIVGPGGIENATRGLMSICQLPVANDEQRGYDLKFIELGKAEQFDDIRTACGSHPTEIHAYRITRNGRSVFYNGESSYTEDVLNLGMGADLFISTAVTLEPHLFHNTAEDVGRAATEARVQRVAVVHWPAEYEGRKEAFAKLVKKHFKGEVIVPNDFTVVKV